MQYAKIVNVLIELLVSVVGGLIGTALYEKVIKKHWIKIKRTTFSALTVFSVISVVVFLVIISVKFTVNQFEIIHLQDRINRYLKGNFPTEFNAGWRITVDEVTPNVMIAFAYSYEESQNPPQHPFDNFFVREEIRKILMNEGYPKDPLWVYSVYPLSEKRRNELLTNHN